MTETFLLLIPEEKKHTNLETVKQDQRDKLLTDSYLKKKLFCFIRWLKQQKNKVKEKRHG